MKTYIKHEIEIYQFALDNCVQFYQKKIVEHPKIYRHLKFGTPLSNSDLIKILRKFGNEITQEFLNTGTSMFQEGKGKGIPVYYQDNNRKFYFKD